MTATYEIRVGDEVRATFAADFAQASSPLTLDGASTPFQVADARHRVGEAARLLVEWCANDGVPVVGGDEEYDVTEVV